MEIHRGKKFSLVRKQRSVGDKIHWGEYIVHPGSVAVLARVGDEILMVRQYRLVLGDYTLEIPAGTLRRGEAPEQAAVREMVEETGYRPLELI